MPNVTGNYDFNLPIVNDPVDGDLWGTQLNANWSSLDGLLQAAGVVSADGGLEPHTDKFLILDGTDTTKKVALDASAVGTGTTVTLGIQNVSGDLYVAGGTPVAVTDGGSGASTLAGGQANLGIFQHMQAFTTSGTFTPATGVTRVYVEVWGAGGGSGGSNSGGASAGGGGGGYSAGYVDVTPGTGYTVTVGTGGTAGVASPVGNGGNGGDSSFAADSVTVTATGGTGGVGMSGFGNKNAVAGGTGSNGDFNLTGGYGGASGAFSGGAPVAGIGGSAPRGGLGGTAGSANPGAASQTGKDGLMPGGGGGGSTSGTSGSSAGAAGADGMVVVYYP